MSGVSGITPLDLAIERLSAKEMTKGEFQLRSYPEGYAVTLLRTNPKMIPHDVWREAQREFDKDTSSGDIFSYEDGLKIIRIWAKYLHVDARDAMITLADSFLELNGISKKKLETDA